MIRFSIFFITTILFFSCSVHGQTKRNYFKIEVGYLSGIGNINYGNQISFVSQGEAFRLRTSYGLFFDSKTSLGIGLGLDGYHNPGHNTLPVFLEAKRYLLDQNTLYSFLNLGSAIELSQAFEKGLFFASGLGYRIDRRKIDLYPSIGINIQQIADGRVIIFDPVSSQISFIQTEITLHSISFNLGIQF